MRLARHGYKVRDGGLAHFLHSALPAIDGGYQKPQISSQASQSPTSGGKTSPIVLSVIVLLAVMFFFCGVLSLLLRFLKKKRSFPSSVSEFSRNPDISGSDAFQRQLQQLFHLHDSGLDQALIDSLPVFLYKEITGLKEPFDCAVCLCEFSEDDKLRLLPTCSHAFHIGCIDTWLLSNSTCPLCRDTLFTSDFHLGNSVFHIDCPNEENVFVDNRVNAVPDQKPAENETMDSKRMFPIRLGKYRNTNEKSRDGGERIEGETSNCASTSSNLDTRRCYSMGSYQYVLAESNLLVALCPKGASGSNVNMKIMRGRDEEKGSCRVAGDGSEEKMINMRSRGESFSVSKIWQWSNKKGKLQNPSETYLDPSSSVNFGLPKL